MRRGTLLLGALIAALSAAGALWFAFGHSSPPARPAAIAGAAHATQTTAASDAPRRQRAAVPRADNGFSFKRLLVETNGDAPEACFRFSDALDSRSEAHYADYLKIEPEITAAIRASGADLCLGGLSYATEYHVTLRRGLPSAAGARTEKDETVAVSLGDRAALVAVSGAGFILPRAASNGLAIETVNVQQVRIRVLRMSDRLLASRIGHQAERWGEMPVLSGEQVTRYQIRELLRTSASLIWSGTMAIEQDHNRTVTTAFPLADIIKPGANGAYLVIAEPADAATPEQFFASIPKENTFDASEQLWTNVPAHWVIATDIALTTMRGQDGLHVFARSLAAAEPLAGVSLSLLSVGQDVLGTATTDAGGHAVFAPGLMRGAGASTPGTVAASAAGGDFTLLDLNRPAFDLSDRGVAGRPAPGPVEAFLYTERGIYRPGETVEAMSLLRDRLGRSIDDMPLTLVLRRPDGLEAKRFALPARKLGGFHESIGLTRTAARGVWSLEALVDPAGAPVGRAEFEVEDFVPQQLKVTLKTAAAALTPGAPLDATLDGEFLYGAPAAGLKGEAELRIVRDPAPVADARGYSFGLVDEKVADAVQKLESPTADDAGHAHISDIVQPPKPTTAPLKGVLSAGLFEPSGRIVEDRVELPIRRQPVLIGIKPRFTEGRVAEDSAAAFDIRAFDAEGHPIARSGLGWRLIREERIYDWFSIGNFWQWHYHVVDQPLASGTIDLAAATPAVLSRKVDWGYYRLIIEDPETQAATSVRFASGWLPTTDAADTPDKVDVTVDKPSAAAGDKFRVRIQGPFAGKAEVTVAGERIFETRAIAVPKEGTVVEVTASENWGAGAYVLVSLYRPLAEGRAHDPARALGLAWLGLDTTKRRLAVSLGARERVTPRQTIEVPIKVEGAGGRQAEVTLAAVDEGILQLTRFATPDPVAFLFGKRRLGIDIRDDYGHLLDGSAEAGRIHEGGDESVGGQGLPVISTRTVALFSGPIELDRDGAARVKLEIPDFEGRLRLMAVAYTHDGAGQGEAALTVRDPVLADLALPRFLAPGDTARAAILLHNTDGAPGDYHLTVSAEGAATLAADHPLDYPLASGERKLDAVAITGVDEGVATLKADLTGPGGYAVHREWQLAVRSPHYPIVLESTARQAAGEDFRVDPQLLDAFVPGSVTISVGYSSYAGIDVASLLQSLYRYPYGCTEQLSSSALPLLYFNDPALLGRIPRDEGVRQRVQEAIDTILDRQDASGEFGLWRSGDGEASPWLNVYAADFLTHAREAGFTVPDAAMQRSYAWLQRAVPEIDQNNRGWYSAAPDATRAYAEFVLARAGRADMGEIRRLHDAAAEASRGTQQEHLIRWRAGGGDDSLAEPLSLGHLAGALTLMGDRPRARDSFELAIAALDNQHYPRWWFDSAYYTAPRDLAGLIAVAAESGDTKVAATLLDRFRALSPSADRLNTQEKAWLLAAAHALDKDAGGRTLSVNGKAVGGLKLPMTLAPGVAEVAAGYTIRNADDTDMWRTLVVQGAPKTAPSAMAAGYTLTKEYFDLAGNPVDPSRLRQNDRVIVSLRGSSSDDDSHRTVLVDLLPAGWEIEAPIVKDTEYGFLGPLSRARLREARDDRFVAAFDLGDDPDWRRRYITLRNDSEPRLASDEFHLAYLARVVTPGSFELPEAVVEDMYRPGVMARTEASQTAADPR